MFLEGGITVFMALIDFIPVLLFFAAGILLIKDLSNKMSKGYFALLSSGIIMVFVSGFLKALWKIIYALEICDYVLLDHAFFPMQSIGFVLTFISLIGIFTRKRNLNALALTVPVYESSMPFVFIQIIGCTGVQTMLFLMAMKMKKHIACICFVMSFVFMLCMGYLSSKFDDSSSMHWIAQLTNIVSQGALFAGVFILHKNGMKDFEFNK